MDIIRAEGGEEYVLEVNTAPSLEENNLQRWGDALANQVALDEYPGLDHPDIEFEDDEDDE